MPRRGRLVQPRLPSTMVVVLGLLSLWDLRVELQLLFQHFTFTALRSAVLAHPLAVAVLLMLPSLQRLISSSDPSVP